MSGKVGTGFANFGTGGQFPNLSGFWLTLLQNQVKDTFFHVTVCGKNEIMTVKPT